MLPVQRVAKIMLSRALAKSLFFVFCEKYQKIIEKKKRKKKKILVGHNIPTGRYTGNIIIFMDSLVDTYLRTRRSVSWRRWRPSSVGYRRRWPATRTRGVGASPATHHTEHGEYGDYDNIRHINLRLTSLNEDIIATFKKDSS